ncbi:hypothetical protein ACHAWU_002890 [Discostella pseudostelligera]|uniref:Uncharacterized protein n=1 Tax=Discostella pseudostelligera TaxID=259834 RepID=A0ABD3LZB4_9STRA
MMDPQRLAVSPSSQENSPVGHYPLTTNNNATGDSSYYNDMQQHHNGKEREEGEVDMSLSSSTTTNIPSGRGVSADAPPSSFVPRACPQDNHPTTTTTTSVSAGATQQPIPPPGMQSGSVVPTQQLSSPSSSLPSPPLPPTTSTLSTPHQTTNTNEFSSTTPMHDVTYTTSLHWKNPASHSLPKRPISLPTDVEHITEVEWADEGPAATHLSTTTTTTTTTTTPATAALNHHSHLVASNLEKAPRPKALRPEPCFCEPDLSLQNTCCIDTSCALFACQEECGTSCPAGPLCGNKRIQRKEWKELCVFDAGTKGRGLAVQEHCHQGDFIVEYVGVAVKRIFLDDLFRRYKNERMLYIMALDNDVYIDARHRGGIARYINHSCEPNCAVHRWKVRGISRACIFATREIKEGEELSFDYQWEYKRGRALTKCYCGAEKCRGTIEMPKDAKERELELKEEAEGNWLEQEEGRAGKELMNRVVKVLAVDTDEYHVADVAHYDSVSGMHLLMYRRDDTAEENWVDLSKEKWMLLEEPQLECGADIVMTGGGESSSYAIARKNLAEDSNETSLLINVSALSGGGGASTSTSTLHVGTPRSDRSSSPIPPSKVRNYMYIQTPIKDAMVTRHTLFKCSQYSRVHIDTIKITIPHGEEAVNGGGGGGDDDEERALLSKAYKESEDGYIWKLVVTGMEVKSAMDWLEKMAGKIHNDLHGIEPSSGNGAAVTGSTIALAPGSPSTASGNTSQTEVIIPRIIVDEVKKRFFSLKGYCYNVDVTFTHSDSKSKQFAKMTLSAEVESDLDRAMEYLYNELTQMCLQSNAPRVPIGVYKDLGFLGGELSHNEFRMLFADLKRSTTTNNDACEDLRGSTFATSFMETNRCSIWVQVEEDMGRVSNNRVINEANPNKPRKIYFGVTPARVHKLWGQLKLRVKDMKRGVRFMHLGPNKIYLPALREAIKMTARENGGGWNYFFDFVKNTSGVVVTVDEITGSSHLRLDGGKDTANVGDIGSAQVDERIDLAEELIYLQIELFRDHHIRKQRWGFGRDWALLLDSDHINGNSLAGSNGPEATASTLAQDVASTTLAPSKPISSADSLRLSDPRAVGVACLEISEIITGSGMSEKVAAHACIIFYRYINLKLSNTGDRAASTNNSSLLNTTTSNSFKLRDVQLASLFIANKSQKVLKWKRLEEVLEHAYRVFYPGSLFNPQSEEAKNWERRVIKAEQMVLSALNYDVFWSGADWVINAVVGTKAMAGPLAENAMALALSGHVLAAGPILWLKYGPKYAFAAIAGFLSIDIEPLFPALSLQPLTVSHAAELIYQSCQGLSRVKKSAALMSSHELFSESNVSNMGSKIQKIQMDCATYISKHPGSQAIDDTKFVSSPAYKEISERAKLSRVFRGVRSDRIEESVLPVLSKISFESKCTIRFSDGMLDGTNDMILEGNWKALSIAEHLLCDVASLPPPVPFEQSAATNAMLQSALFGVHAQQLNRKSQAGGIVIKQVKDKPGLLDMQKIDGKHGWYGAFDNMEETYDAGWKTCVAANAPHEHLDSAGLRWWVPHQFGPSLSGSLCEIFTSPKLINNNTVDMRALALLAQSFAGGYSRMQVEYPTLASHLSGPEGEEAQENDRSVAVSLQRWPPEKIEMKENSSSGQSMQMGYSAAALQEMQLLHQLHFLIPSPQGHPNFMLPLAIALDSDAKDEPAPETSSSITSSNAANDILAMIERNQRAAGKRQLSPGSHLVLEPTPLNLQKVMSWCQRKSNAAAIIPPAVLASWCHDILSALSFCHSNHIILRSLLPDQIHLDHSGTAKLSGLSKVMVLHGKDRTREFDPLKYVRSKKGKDHNTEDVEPFAAPEILLGGTRHTKETDMWAFGALLANLLLGKQLFPGKDRVSKMTQVFKIVGVPDSDNYEKAKKFPYYTNNMFVIGEEGKKKKYSRGVEKALRHLLKAQSRDDHADFAGLISLIDGLLHLDPKKRMTADDAMRHPYMVNYSAQIERQEFRQNFVKDWLGMKENVLTRGKSSKSRILNSVVADPANDDDVGVGSIADRNDLKRSAFLLGASSTTGVEDGDDLYDFSFGLSTSSKKQKLSDD